MGNEYTILKLPNHLFSFIKEIINSKKRKLQFSIFLYGMSKVAM